MGFAFFRMAEAEARAKTEVKAKVEAKTGTDGAERKSLSRMTKEELVRLAEEFGIDAGGTAADLRGRIRAAQSGGG